MGKAAWDSYHAELDLRGQQMSVVESLGGVVSRSVASKAWKSAQKNAFTPSIRRRRQWGGGSGGGSGGSDYLLQRPKKPLPCYWCNKKGHAGKTCPDKLAGKPFHPQSRAASWPDGRLAAVKQVRKKVRIEKPKGKK